MHALLSGGEAGQERRSHDGDSEYVVAVFKILIFQNLKRFEDVNRGTVWPIVRCVASNTVGAFRVNCIGF